MMRAAFYALAGAMVIAQSAAAQGDSARTDSARTDSSGIGPPIRRIASASAVSKQRLGWIQGVRELPDGRVLVNDPMSRRLLLLDTTLATVRVVLDSATGRENTYGNETGTLIGHRGDSTLFIDRNSLAMLVIDPDGNVVRVRSVPRAQDVFRFASGRIEAGAEFTDAKGRLVYVMDARPPEALRRPPRGAPYVPQRPDSAFIVGLDMETRKVDTVGTIRIPKTRHVVRVSPRGGWSVGDAVNPLPTTDAWTTLPDGSLALLRGIDLRVDYVNADGTRSSSAKIPFDWQPISDEARQRLVDSVRTTLDQRARQQYTGDVIRWVNFYDRKYPPGFTAPEGYRPPLGFGRDWKFPPGVTFPANYIYGCGAGEEPKELAPVRATTDSSAIAVPADAARNAAAAARAARMGAREMAGGAAGRLAGSRETIGMMGGPGGGRPSCIPLPVANMGSRRGGMRGRGGSDDLEPPSMRPVDVVSPRELPDFRPPIAAGAVRADLDGNLWIQTIPPTVSGGVVYDVVSREGQLLERLQLPPNYALAGFGRDRIVFLVMRDRSGAHLARVRLK